MSPVICAAACALAGLAAVGAGIALIKRNEVGPDESAFVGALSPRSLGYSGGWIVLFTGLFLLVIIAPMLYLRGGIG